MKIYLNILYRVYHGELSTLQFLFVNHRDIHMHDTRQSGHYHIPVCRTNLGKSNLWYFGAWLWNKILSAHINPNVSDFISSRNLKTAIYNSLLKKKFYKDACCILLTKCVVIVAPSAPLHPCCDKWYLSVSVSFGVLMYYGNVYWETIKLFEFNLKLLEFELWYCGKKRDNLAWHNEPYLSKIPHV